MGARMTKEETVVLRHSFVELAEHWVLAISGLLLIFSGFGELPMYKRFMVTRIPGLGWAGDFLINLKIHYLSGIAFVSVMVFHAIYHGWLGHQGLLPRKGDLKAALLTILSMFGLGEEPKAHKYLPEQRLAYAYLGGVGLVLVLTGVVKVIKNLPGTTLSPTLITWSTLIHTFATVFFLIGVLAHVAALFFKVNRPLVKSIFTRKVDLDYVRRRHTIWYEDLLKNVERENLEDEKGVHVTEGGEGGEGAEKKAETPRVEEKEGEGMTSIWKVKGMSCEHCVMSVTKALNQLNGIKNVQVNLSKGEIQFDNTSNLPPDQIQKAIEDAGYQVLSRS